MALKAVPFFQKEAPPPSQKNDKIQGAVSNVPLPTSETCHILSAKAPSRSSQLHMLLLNALCCYNGSRAHLPCSPA